ncbi:hypothetical protein [Parasphaerochaeta coccoides]|uniref:Uncharacterized protein n=1 Tax=Parasphaerochaeta coccoides (strain ATCC BAA-1237 / DSM 17374 / SPN1) TaxID=760011 RepID=F4GKZ5_PARC1|nr:hypothetical protein [Parasphaerochaeta coccoides]AEC01908.1 hypothetical protein Spico_0682 [Parasphaerochaeta coccoides DSM 17374]
MPDYIEAFLIFVLLVITGIVCLRRLLSSKIFYWLIPFIVTAALGYESFVRLGEVIAEGKRPDHYFSMAVGLWVVVVVLISAMVRIFSTSKAPVFSHRKRRKIHPEAEYRRLRGQILTTYRKKKKELPRTYVPRIPAYSRQWIDLLDA